MTRFILIRHGETDWNIEGRWQGQADVPLNSRGREQAAKLAQTLTGMDISIIYASDLSRTVETASILARSLNVELRLDARLREIHQGEWQGVLSSEIQKKYADEFRRRRDNPMSVAPPGGETASQVMERVAAAIEDIRLSHPEETVAIVSHGFAIACLLIRYKNIPVEKLWELIPDNGVWNEIRV